MDIGRAYGIGNQGNFSGSLYDTKSKSSKGIGISKAAVRQGGKLTVKKKISAANYMMRVAQAKSPSQISAVIRTARADMQFVKRCNSEKADIEKAMRILKQVVAKGHLKAERLKAEAEMERQEKAARSADKKELEEKIREKRNRKKKARCAGETADTYNNEEVTVSRTTYFETVDMGVFGGADVGAAGASAAVAGTAAPADAGNCVEAFV